MSNKQEKTFPRRQFLRGAAGVVGVSMLGAGAPGVLAKALGDQSGVGDNALTLAFWDGRRFVSAQSLLAGDSTLDRVQLTLQVFGGHGDFQSIDGNAIVPAASAAQAVAFHAWTAPPKGAAKVRFFMTVDPNRGLELLVHRSGLATTDLAFSGSSAPGPKLHQGTYLLASGNVNLNGLELKIGQDGGPVAGVSGQYIIIDIQQA